MALEILIPKPDTPQRRAAAAEAPGRPWVRPAGGWVNDLAALRQTVMLCEFCDPKWNPRRAQYEPWRRDLWVTARCDACKQMSRHVKTYIHESLHVTVGDPETRRRRGRWGSFLRSW